MGSAPTRSPPDAANGLVDLRPHDAAPTLDGEAVAMAAHEIMGALTPLQGWLGMLATGALDADRDARREAVAVMKRAAGRLQRLTGDLLDLSALDAGGLRVQARPVDVASIAARALRAFAGTAPRRPVEVSTPLRVAAIADPLRVEQVFANLLTNADHHAPLGTSLRVGANSVGASVIVWVSDSGPSIHPEDRRRLFRPFARGRAAARRGHGLGLAISKRLVEAMGGRMGVVSSGTDGPSFFFTLPAAPRETRESPT